MKTDFLHYSKHFILLFLYVAIVLTRQIKCGCSRESEEWVNSIAVKLRQMEANDCMLYTPTLADYENCSNSTLHCFMWEMDVLLFEIDNPLKRRLPKTLKNLTRQLHDKRKPCPKCEFYHEKRAVTFVETLQSILQKMNADNC